MSLLPQTQTEQTEGEIPSAYLEFKDKFIDFALRNTRDDETAFLLAVRLMAALICEKSEFVFERLHFRERFADDPGRSYDFVAFEDRTLHFFVLDSKLFERDDETVSLPMMDVEVRGMQTLFSHAEKTYAVTPTGQEDAHALCALILSRLSKALPTDDVDEIHVHYLALNPVPETFVEPIDNEIGNLRVRVSEWSPALVLPTIDLLTVAAVKAFSSTQNLPKAKKPESDDGVNSAEEYRRKILQTVASEKFPADRIFDLFAKTLVRVGLFEDIHAAHCSEMQIGALRFALSGYAYDPQSCVLSLFLLDWGPYVRSDSPEPLRTTDVNRLTRRLLNFYHLASHNRLLIKGLDAQTDAGKAASDIFRWSASETGSKIKQLKCVTLTLRSDKTEKKDLLEEFQYGGNRLSCVRLVYDYRSLYELSHSSAEVVINFEDPKEEFEPVDMIEAFNRQDGYRAYLGRMPAVNLARIYDRYGQRVLNGNVRAFLQSNNRVNKGMLKTAKEDAESFFAYNNGICVVAREMATSRHGTADRIVSVRDFQIVNGGQTTATLHKLWNDFRRKTKSEPEAANVLKNVYVPMKLTVPSPTCSDEQREALIMNISKFANSQSAVSNADLGANTHFQIKFKSQSEHSRCAIRPSLGGSGTVTYWYYERSRGSYKVESERDEAILTKRKKKGKSPFELRYPKKFTKTDLAKWIKAWDQVPHIVSRGSQKCYAAFEADVRNAEKQDPSLSFVTPEYVQYCIGKGILFRQVDSVVAGTSWYKAAKSYKANLVCYAVAYLSLTLQRLYGKEAELDFFRIWDKQATPTNLAPIVERMARLASETFNWEDRGWDDVGEWVKKKECWEKMSEHVMDFSDAEKRLLRDWTVLRIPEYNPVVETSSETATDAE